MARLSDGARQHTYLRGEFEKSDNNRISEVWQMNEQEAKAIVEKIIQADKVVHSQ